MGKQEPQQTVISMLQGLYMLHGYTPYFVHLCTCKYFSLVQICVVHVELFGYCA